MASHGVEVYLPGYLEEYSGDTCIRVAAAIITLQTLAVGARFIARKKIEAPLGTDQKIKTHFVTSRCY